MTQVEWLTYAIAHFEEHGLDVTAAKLREYLAEELAQ